MPPPKKPKVGRTSLEQFLSEEERHRGDPGVHRDTRDSEGNSPAATIDEGSDGEVFSAPSDSEKDDSSRHNSVSEDRKTLFHKLLLKSRSIDEQKVPGSPDENVPSPTASPPAETAKTGAFRKYQDHLRMELDAHRQFQVKLECMAPTENGGDKELNGNAVYNRDLVCESSPAPQPKLTTDQGRLIDTLVASALATSAAHSIIYGGRPAYTSNVNTYQSGQNLSFSTCSMKTFENEPHDLTKKPDTNKFFGHRFYDGLKAGDQGRLASVYREWALRQSTGSAFERSKQYLDSHRRIVGLLSERSEDTTPDDRTPDKENVVQNVPARYPNGVFNPASINRVFGGYRYDAHQRFVNLLCCFSLP